MGGTFCSNGYTQFMAQPDNKFHVLSRLFHWAVAALVVFQIPLAYRMIAMPLGTDKFAAFALHKSLGMTVFALTALRLAWRLVKPPPGLPTNMSGRERGLAHAAHAVLYVVTFGMPLTGWCYSVASGYSVSMFGLFVLPDLVPADEALAEVFESLHRLLSYALMSVLVLHVLAAAHHHVVRRDNVLISMLPFLKLR
jgi:cytochrome b561